MRALLFSLVLPLWAGATPWPDLATPVDAPPDAAGDAAVLIGIEDYAFIPDVPGAALNLTDWYRDLRARGVPLDRITLLRDAQATREEILEALRQGAARVAEGGRLWVIFVGHGAPGSAGDGLIVGVDAQQTARSLEARSVPQSAVLAAVATAPTAVVLLDACFSGRDAAGGALVPGLQPLVPVAPPALPAQAVLPHGRCRPVRRPCRAWPGPPVTASGACALLG
ncbi:MAG: caspase family protein [bacterium]